ncbi:uncharacterized protein NESG_01235 [Nematocida ausubeli]|uniref:Uncharacterized protein n=1 Tax=Nematocida ausubeli (strain ATCC PRA-371 / ERTm2) TaxID=1913371 RepID=A0A086J1V2_NEMA1|nr:uncharacterized protein NESG_01235 [Nematocida ausubeli]KFG26120.1 hypothetical protein NESG_01235 [Nematocida ausubeli]
MDREKEEEGKTYDTWCNKKCTDLTASEEIDEICQGNRQISHESLIGIPSNQIDQLKVSANKEFLQLDLTVNNIQKIFDRIISSRRASAQGMSVSNKKQKENVLIRGLNEKIKEMSIMLDITQSQLKIKQKKIENLEEIVKNLRDGVEGGQKKENLEEIAGEKSRRHGGILEKNILKIITKRLGNAEDKEIL